MGTTKENFVNQTVCRIRQHCISKELVEDFTFKLSKNDVMEGLGRSRMYEIVYEKMGEMFRGPMYTDTISKVETIGSMIILYITPSTIVQHTTFDDMNQKV